MKVKYGQLALWILVKSWAVAPCIVFEGVLNGLKNVFKSALNDILK